MPRPFALGGVIASVLLIAIGIGSVVIGLSGRSEVRDDVRLEKIAGTPDMTPALIRTAVDEAGLKNVVIPDCSVAGQAIDTGARAKCFAKYMRIHALEATGGRVYAEMGQYLTADGKETSDKAEAAVDPKTKQPVANGARNVWVTETALTTALNTSFFAEQVALFSIVMGIALLLVGIGFLVLTSSLLRGPRRITAAVASKVAVA
ncbi:MAG: hypothetical protein ACJ762_16180 [Solirubrobacteraceae bacterium]